MLLPTGLGPGEKSLEPLGKQLTPDSEHFNYTFGIPPEKGCAGAPGAVYFSNGTVYHNKKAPAAWSRCGRCLRKSETFCDSEARERSELGLSCCSRDRSLQNPLD